ncbi:MAG: HAMP domain-containing sensor histidine kinase, partial [Acidobacteriota bacterium]
SALPGPLAPYASAPDGVHEVGFVPLDDHELFFLVHTLESGERLYFYLDADSVEVLGGSLGRLGQVLLVCAVLVTLIGALLGRSTAHRAVEPVLRLASKVRRQPAAHPLQLSRGLPDDEVRILAEAIEASAERSQAYLERERRFTRDASHELRTPVTVIRGALELLEALPATGTGSLGQPLERIRRANEDMAQLIEAFLWLSREEALADAGTPRSLGEEAQQAVARYRHLLEDKPVELEIEVAESTHVVAPRGVLGIVLGNLIANAFQYTRQGRVEIRGGRVGEQIELSVCDTGPGISPDRLHSVVEAHHQGRDSQGFGLGLAITHGLCERFGWRLTLDSEGRDGEGTCARVIFPVDV